MQKRIAGPGSITQWISTCQCDELKFDSQDDSVNEQILLCTLCNKRIEAGRVGSLTQWVFRSDLCACKAPVPIATRRAALISPDVNTQNTQNTTGTYQDGEFVGHGPADESLSVDPDSFPTDRYRALSEIGRGAAGIVYRAIDRVLQKEIAIKCLKTVTANELMLFQKEAQATSRLNHPNIVKIFDFGASHGGAPYMVMEFVSGISLKRLIDKDGPLSQQKALPLFLDLARALEHAHSKGIFHRDIKSSNVIFSENLEDPGKQNVRLIDFGVAALKGVESPPGMKTILVGTPPYMAPEQLNGTPFDARSEVYSLGCLFYEILTGSPPFLGDTALETLNMHANQPVAPLSEARPDSHFTEDVETLVLRCLSKQPDERFQSMHELAAQLESLSTIPSMNNATHESEMVDTIYGAQSNRGVSMAVFAALALIIVFGAGTVVFYLLAPFNNREVPHVKLMSPTNKDLMSRPPNDWVANPRDKEDFFFRGDRASVTSGNDNSLDRLSNRGEIKHLRLLRCKITEKGAAKLKSLKLKSIQIENTTFDTGGLTVLGGISTIEQLTIAHCKWFTGRALEYFENLPLTEIRLEDCNLRDSFLVFLKKHKRLEKLMIIQSPQFTGASLTDLAGCTKLSFLQLVDLPALSEQCFFQIAKLPSITSLSLKDSYFVPGRTRDDIATASGGSSGTPYDLKAFEQITSIKQLVVLSLDGDRLEDQHFDAISKMKTLHNLALVGRKIIKPVNIEKLSKMPTLGIFRIIGPCLESDGIRQICAMPNIKRLALFDCELTDRSLAEFPKSNTMHLIIDGNNSISGVGLDYIAKMPHLNLLRLPAESYITTIDLKRFRTKKPDCRLDEKK